MNFLSFLEAIGAGVLLLFSGGITFLLIKKIIKVKEEEGIIISIVFLIFNIPLIILPIFLPIALYLNNGISYLIVMLSSAFIIISFLYIYEKIIRITFLIKLDKDLYYKLKDEAHKKNIPLKKFIYQNLKK